MSRTVPRTDEWSRLNAIERRLSALERVAQPGEQSDFTNTPLTTSSDTFTTISGQPDTISAAIGASGDARITVGGLLETSAVDDTAYIGLSIDGAAALPCLELGATASIINGTVTLTFLASEIMGEPLGPGTHTFELQFRSSTAGHDVFFAAVSIVVKPI
jgi:hypothetical protein